MFMRNYLIQFEAYNNSEMETTGDVMATAGTNLNYSESTIIKIRTLNKKFKKGQITIAILP